MQKSETGQATLYEGVRLLICVDAFRGVNQLQDYPEPFADEIGDLDLEVGIAPLVVTGVLR